MSVKFDSFIKSDKSKCESNQNTIKVWTSYSSKHLTNEQKRKSQYLQTLK